VNLAPRQIGWVPQQPAIYGRLSVRENLALFAQLESVEDAPEAVARMLDQTGLAERADDLVCTLSGGNQQRVNIAIGLLGRPAAMLLDEPSGSLDPHQRGRMWEFIGTLTAAGTVVLFTTHDVAEAERHADRVIVLEAGRVIYDMAPSELHAAACERAGDPTADFETAFAALLSDLEAEA
jgi:ABC-2 type transport system ATP-binding protein